MFTYQKTTLQNGLRVVTVPLINAPSTTIGILVGAGSRYENIQTNGLAHILEHMFFKGTKRRPTAAIIAHESEGMGAIQNAWTDVEAVAYWMKVPPEHFLQSLDILSDMLTQPLLSAKELDKERHVVIEELNRDEDDYPRKVGELFQELLWPKQALGRPIIGSKKTILAASQADLLNYLHKLYVASNMVVAVAGPVNHDQVVRAVTQQLARLPAAKPALSWERAQEHQKSPQLLVFKKRAEQAHLLLGFRAFGFDDRRRAILTVLNAVLGVGMSSRLFLNVREEKHLAYTIASSSDYFHDTGAWGIYAGVTTNRLLEALAAIKEELVKVKTELVDEKELAEAKERYKGRLLFGLESSHGVMEFVGRQEMIEEHIWLPEDWLQKVMAVTASDVRTLAQELITDDRLNLVVLGPYDAAMKKELAKQLSVG